MYIIILCTYVHVIVVVNLKERSLKRLLFLVNDAQNLRNRNLVLINVLKNLCYMKYFVNICSQYIGIRTLLQFQYYREIFF